MILVGREFVILSNLSFILHNASPSRKAKRITQLGRCIILIGSKCEVSNSLGLILHNASFVRKAGGITFLS
jgi:hypothetical protein